MKVSASQLNYWLGDDEVRSIFAKIRFERSKEGIYTATVVPNALSKFMVLLVSPLLLIWGGVKMVLETLLSYWGETYAVQYTFNNSFPLYGEINNYYITHGGKFDEADKE